MSAFVPATTLELAPPTLEPPPPPTLEPPPPPQLHDRPTKEELDVLEKQKKKGLLIISAMKVSRNGHRNKHMQT